MPVMAARRQGVAPVSARRRGPSLPSPAWLSLSGVALFAWPFLTATAVPDGPALATALGALGGLLLAEAGARRLDARLLFLVLCAGWVFGPSYGFEAGAVALLVSAIATGGIGPWLPYQLFGVGWVGLAAGAASQLVDRVTGHPVAAPSRRDLIVLAAVGALMGLVYGALLDVWDWTFFRGSPGLGWVPGLALWATFERFGRFYLATSLWYDSFRAVGNALMVLGLGAPVLAALWRVRLRSSFRVVEAAPATAASGGVGPSGRGI
jgi:energy-coupling factor transport system substrate-specific component